VLLLDAVLLDFVPSLDTALVVMPILSQSCDSEVVLIQHPHNFGL